MLTVLGDKYRLVRQLGQGGMGAVHEAVHAGTGRRVAVKTLRDGALFDEGALARFQREARAAGAIDTKHIVQVLDSGFDAPSGQHYMVMELLEGEDLLHLVTRLGPLPPDLARCIAAQACAGLVKAHQAGVVHRDVKPANIFLATLEDGEVLVKLLDFGIAKTTVDRLGDVESAALTRTGNMLGTPLYMSPEQAKGLKSIDHRTDVWSLGAVLFQMLTARPPHHWVEHTMGQLIVAIVTEEPRSPRELAPWVSPEVAAIVGRALRLEPAERYATAAEMLEALRGCLPGGAALRPEMLVALPAEQRASAPRTVVFGSAMPSAEDIEEVGVASTTYQGTARTRADAPPPKRSRKALAAAAAALALTGAAALAAGVGRHAPAASAPATSAPATSAQAASAPAEPKAVRLAVPAGATVEIDGARADVTDGAVSIAGALGTKHAVALRAGDRAAEVEVVVTEDGAFPARVELPEAAAGTAPSASAPAPSAHAVEARPHAAPASPTAPVPAPAPATPSPKPAGTGTAPSAAVPAHATTFE